MKNHSCSGLSLIELLMASIVVASAGALLVSGLLSANRGADLYVERARLTQLLASQLALLDEPLPHDASTQGTFPGLPDWSWTLQWQASPFSPLQETTMTVAHQAQAHRVVTYRTLAEQ